MGYCRPLNKMQLRRMPHEAQARRRATAWGAVEEVVTRRRERISREAAWAKTAWECRRAMRRMLAMEGELVAELKRREWMERKRSAS